MKTLHKIQIGFLCLGLLGITQLAFSETATMKIVNLNGGKCTIPPNELTVITDNNVKARVSKDYTFQIPAGAKAVEVIGESDTCKNELCSNNCGKVAAQNPEDAADCKQCSSLCSEVTLGSEPAAPDETVEIPCD